MPIYVVPDLALLVCPPDSDPYHQDFLDGYWRVFLLHDEQIEAYGFQYPYARNQYDRVTVEGNLLD
jgi:hypothetical protein